MATIGSKKMSLVDVATATQDGKVQKLAELLTEDNEILLDIPWQECNQGDTHKTVQRTGLPSAAWRELNKGVQPSKSTKKPCIDSTGIAEARSEVDEDIAELNGNVRENRYMEDIAFVESLNQSVAETLFYGNTNSTPASFLGLAPRLCDPTAANGDNLLNGGGSSTGNTSIYLCGWGENTMFGLYPRGSKAGLVIEDKGKEPVTDSSGGTYYSYVTQFKWKPGLCVKDWRYFGRICNIAVASLSPTAATGANLIQKLIELTEVVKSTGNVKQAIYVNKTIRTWMRIQIANKSNMHLTYEDFAGKRVVAFDGIPVRVCDQILNTESAITFS